MKWCLMIAVGLVAFTLARSAWCDTVIFDDFEDGSAVDDAPVTWNQFAAWPFTTLDVVNGDLHVSTTNPQAAGVIGVPAPMTDVSIRARVFLAVPEVGAAGMFARGVESTGASYFTEIGADGTFWLGPNPNPSTISTSLRPSEHDVMLQVDAIGDVVQAWAWRAGEARPTSPLLTRSGRIISEGGPGVYYGPANLAIVNPTVPGIAVFRYYHVANSPIKDLWGVCDFTGEGFCTTEDIDMLVRLGDLSSGIQVPPEYPNMDLNGDEIVNTQDITQWLDNAAAENGYSEPYPLGDTNLDGIVDFQDFVNLNNNWQATHLEQGTPVAWSSGDFDGNGIVAFPDFVAQNNNWQRAIAVASAVAVPEPSAILLLVLGGILFSGHHRHGRSVTN